MDWYPLLNSLRIAAISAVVVFFAGIAAAYYIAKLPRLVKGILDVILTLPLVLPPTVVGYLLLRVLGPKRLIGAWVLETFGIRLVMTWWSAIFATVVVFPLMYRTVRGAFEAFDETLAYAGQTLGNEFISLIKETSVVSFVGATDLYLAFQRIGSNTYDFMVPYLVMAVIYIIMVLVISTLIKIMERSLRKSDYR